MLRLCLGLALLVRVLPFPILCDRVGHVRPLYLSPLHGVKLSPLPPGISPNSKQRRIDVQSYIRALASGALKKAMDDGIPLLEVEFPPLLGGQRAKRQTDDYSQIEVLDANRDWTMALSVTPELASLGSNLWLVFPDEKELELVLENFPGKRYRVPTLTSITGAAKLLSSSPAAAASASPAGGGGFGAAAQASVDAGVQEPFFSGEWFAAEFKKLGGGGGGSSSTTTSSSTSSRDSTEGGRSSGSSGGGDGGEVQSSSGCPPPPLLSIVCQPGDGGPMEDWLNVELLEPPRPGGARSGGGAAAQAWTPGSAMLVVNGQLDKLRDGYYNKFIFPKIAKATDRFYRDFEPILYLKPLLDKGFAGWLYRVYPEPWQVVLQQKEDGEAGTVVATFEERPTFNEAVSIMKRAGFERAGG